MTRSMAWLAVWLSSGLAGCGDSDVGRCCRVSSEADPSIIPISSTTSSGDFINDIAQDPALVCDALTCVAYRGSEPYCTAPCNEDDDCPVGFVCAEVLRSDPGPDAPIQPEDRFCIRPREAATCEP